MDIIEKLKIAEATEVLQTLTRIMRREENQVCSANNITIFGPCLNHFCRFFVSEFIIIFSFGGFQPYSMWTDKFDIDGNMDLKVVVDYGDGGNEAPDDS
jgi:phage terminase small subunit